MIESESKRERIKDIIGRWAKYTKIEQYLRDHDIPSLVDQVITEFYHIKLCCGHWIRDYSESFDFAYKTWDCDWEGSGWSTVSGNYCRECYERMKKDYDEQGYPINYEVKCPICNKDLVTFPSEGLIEDNSAYCDHRMLDAAEYVDLTYYGVRWGLIKEEKKDSDMLDQCPKCGERTFDGEKCLGLYCGKYEEKRIVKE